MRPNKEISINLLLLSALLVLAGWHFRAGIRERFVVQRPVPMTTVLYSWTDSKGVVHFSQDSPAFRARPIVVNTEHITPLEPLPLGQVSSYSLASGVNLRSGGTAAAPEGGDLRANMEAQATDSN